MLIFDSKQGKFGTQKIKQWGSISAVRSAVFRNAEAMGIDPETLVHYLPFWGCTRNANVDVIQKIDTVVSNSVNFVNEGVLNTGTDSYISIDDTNQIEGQPEYTVFATVIRRTSLPTSDYCRIFDKNGGVVALGFDTNHMAVWQGAWHYANYTMPVNVPINVCITFSSENLKFYIDSVLLSAFSGVPTPGTGAGKLYIGNQDSSDDSYFRGQLNQFYMSHGSFSKNQIAQLHDTPYALLQPNPTPLIFDWGAGGGTLLSYLYGSAAITTTNISSLFDSSAKVSSSVSDIYDSSVQVSKAIEQVFDSAAKVVSVISDSYDTNAIVATLGTLVYNLDTLVKVTTDISDEYDTKAACSTLREYSYDTRAIIATVIEKLVDSSVPVSSVLTQLYDTVCAVTEATPSTGTLTPETIDAIATAVWAKMLDSGMVAKTALDMAATESTKARQMQTNNAEVAEDGSQSVIYDDDGSTPLVTFNHPTNKKRVKV